MEIDLKNPTEEQIKALKEVAPGLAAQLGLVDPGKPITREQAEKLSFTRKVSGEEKTDTIWDISQEASKGQGADAKIREASEKLKAAETARAIVEAQERFRTALAAKQTPEKADIKIMAESLGVPVEDLMGSIEADTEADPKKNGKAPETAFKLGPESITLDMLPKDLRDDIMYLREQKAESAQSELDKLIQKSLDGDKTVATLLEKHGGSTEEKAALKSVLFDNAKLRIEGRIPRLPAGTTAADLGREIDEAVSRTAETQQRAGIPTKTAPQPIILGPSEPGGPEVRILSDEKVKTDLPIDHPDFTRNQALVAAQNQAKAEAEAATAPT